MGKSMSFDASTILKIAVILFILFLGLTDMMKAGKVGNFTNPFAIQTLKDGGDIGKAKNLSMIFGVVEVVCAAFLCVAMFVDLKGITPIANLVIMIIWAIRAILVSFVWQSLPKNPKMEDLFAWLTILMLQIIVLAAIWATGKKA